ncbi:hypothetical protein HK101_006866 [Irineochytrium annulatum]|nr:hypothetical protein HK101_006866 [Irineochytrium annulatum]
MIDSSCFHPSQHVRPAAELLADILGSPAVVRHRTPVLIVCNKADGMLAVDKVRVKQVLEAEIDRIRATRAAGLESQNGVGGQGGNKWEYIGLEGRPFTFEDVTVQVEFVETSVKNVKDGQEEKGGLKEGKVVERNVEEGELAEGFQRVVQFMMGR